MDLRVLPMLLQHESLQVEDWLLLALTPQVCVGGGAHCLFYGFCKVLQPVIKGMP